MNSNPWSSGPSLGGLIHEAFSVLVFPCGMVLYAVVLAVFFVALRRSRRVALIALYVGLAYLGGVVGVFLISGVIADPRLVPVAGLLAIGGALLYVPAILGGWLRIRFTHNTRGR